MDFILVRGSDSRDLTMWKSFRTLVPLSPFPCSPFPVPLSLVISPPPRTELTGGCAGIGAADIQKLKSAGICTVYVSPLSSPNTLQTQSSPRRTPGYPPLLQDLMPPRQISHARLCFVLCVTRDLTTIRQSKQLQNEIYLKLKV